MEKQLMLKLLKYEIEMLRFIDRIEDNIISMGFEGSFNDTRGAAMYELYDLVLDELGVPPDSDGYPGRDIYLNMYFDVWTCNDWEKNKDKRVKALIYDIKRILGKNKPKKKKKSKT